VVAMHLVLTSVAVQAVVLGGMVLLARRRGRSAGRPVLDEAFDVLEELAAEAESVAAAAERAAAAAERARHRAGSAVEARDLAERRYREQWRLALATGDSRRLVERAALNAYRSGQLSVTQLNRIWQHTRTAEAPAMVPAGDGVREARQQYEQAVAEVAHVHEEARVTTVAARALAEEATVAESQLSDALHAADTGLGGLFQTS